MVKNMFDDGPGPFASQESVARHERAEEKNFVKTNPFDFILSIVEFAFFLLILGFFAYAGTILQLLDMLVWPWLKWVMLIMIIAGSAETLYRTGKSHSNLIRGVGEIIVGFAAVGAALLEIHGNELKAALQIIAIAGGIVAVLNGRSTIDAHFQEKRRPE